MQNPILADMTDDAEQLIQRASNGDATAIQALLARHLPALRAYVHVRVGPRVRSQETDSDVLQSVCGELLQSLSGFEYRGEAAFRQWLYTAAVRKLVAKDRYYRTNKRDTHRNLQGVADPDASWSQSLAPMLADQLASPSQQAMAAETRERLEQVLAAMPQEHREVIVMSRIAGLSHAEIAARLGIAPSSVRSALSRALARLGRLLGSTDDR